jgi:hypothetical protein
MAQIFISHSAKDKELVAFLSKAFASTKVKAVFEEFEAIGKAPPNAQQIANHIRESNAVFVLLSRNVEELKHTRDWVAYEGGVATATALQTNKDIWVLEPLGETEGISVVIPHFRHYVCFDHSDERWQAYLTQIINSYDDSHFLKAISGGAATGAVFGEGVGALWGAGVGLLLAAMVPTGRPLGFPILCPHCASSYNVHPSGPRIRCAVCNRRLIIKPGPLDNS